MTTKSNNAEIISSEESVTKVYEDKKYDGKVKFKINIFLSKNGQSGSVENQTLRQNRLIQLSN